MHKSICIIPKEPLEVPGQEVQESIGPGKTQEL